MLGAGALQAKQEYYRSACTAKDIADWSGNGNVYRVNSLVQRTRRLMAVAPSITIGTVASMIDGAERNLAVDVESALKSAGEAHDMMYGLLTDYFANEMSELMGMVSASRRKKVEIGYGYTLIGRARAFPSLDSTSFTSMPSSSARVLSAETAFMALSIAFWMTVSRSATIRFESSSAS